MKKKRNLFMSTTLMSAFFLISFKFNSTTITWMWQGDRVIPIILGVLTLVLAVFWIKESK